MSLPKPGPDRTAVVTGASSGIGEEIARELARRGHGVTLVARREDKLAALAAELGDTAHVLAADLSKRSDRAALLGRIEALGLTPDILVNNAGLSTLGPVAASDPEAELNMIEVDVASVVDLCSRFLPGMTSRRRGAILNVASTAAFQPLPGQAGYGACKAFVLSYTQSLTGELNGTGASPRLPCAPARSTPASVRQRVSRRRTPKPHCRRSCGCPPTSSPRPASTVWPRAGWSRFRGQSTASRRCSPR